MQTLRVNPPGRVGFKASAPKISGVKLPNVSRQLAMFQNNALRNLYVAQREGASVDRSIGYQAKNSPIGGNSF